MAVQYLDSGNEDGTVLGQAATSKIGFYGKTPVVQPAAIADATDSDTALSQGNLVIAALVAVGILPAA